MTGADDLYWYVPANSPIKSFKDTDGKTAAYSTTGASTHVTLLALIKHFGTSTKPGARSVTITCKLGTRSLSISRTLTILKPA